MKKLIKKTISVFVAAIFILTGCEKEQKEITTSKLDLKKFKDYGKTHTDVLDYFNSFTPPTNIKNLNEGLDFTFNKIQSILDENLNANVEDKKLAKNNKVNSFTRSLVDFRESKRIIFSSQGQFRSKKTEQTIDEILTDVSSLNVLSNFALEKLNELKTLSELYFNNSITTSEIKNSLSIIEEELIAKNYSENDDEGITIAIILSISNASIDWWENESKSNTQNASKGNRKPLPAWAGADIAGAVVGAAHQLVVSGGDLSWSGTGSAALLGAAATSTGAVSGLGRWISSLF